MDSKNGKKKYSEMIIEIYNEFESFLPEKLSFQEVIELCIESWNIAIDKDGLEDRTYAKTINKYEYSSVVEKIIDYKSKHFPDSQNVIVDFSMENDRLQIKHQSQIEYFNSKLSQILFKGNSKQSVKGSSKRK